MRWNLTYQEGSDITGRPAPDFGYIWNNAAPPAATNFNSCGPVNTVTPPPAPYPVTFPCVFAPPDNVLVGASGPSTDFCSLASPRPWSGSGTTVIVPAVDCCHVNGVNSPADDFFATYTTG